MTYRRFVSRMAALCTAVGLLCSSPFSPQALAATRAIGPGDYLKANGTVLRNNYGTGEVVNLRGTNLGGWLLQEGWMSPNGEAALVRNGWSAWASTNGNSGTGAAFDGAAGTRWSSGVPQAAGQTFTVNLGAKRAFDEISIDAGASIGDYPSSFDVEVSNDNANWKRLQSVNANSQRVVVHLQDQTDTQYVRLKLTAGKGNWWSIHEFQAYVSDDFNTRRVLNERFGAATAKSLIDVHQDTWIQAVDLDNVKAMGMNLVRVPIYWQVLMNPNGTMKPDSEAFRKLDWVVAESARRGLYVMLDFHGSPGAHCPWQSCGQMGSNQLWNNATNQDWSVQIWQRLATRYNGNPTVAAYDLMNEPLLSYNETPAQVRQKFDLYDRMYRAVRAIDPDHVIVMAAFFGFGNALPPSTYGWTNVMYQTHHYDFDNPNSFAAQNALIERGIADLTKYQKDWQVPVFAGEFWFHNFNDLYGKWLSGLNASNISWANWAYKNRNPGGNLDASGLPNATNWGFYLGTNNPPPVPDMNSDSAATIAAKWAAFGTGNFVAQTDFAKVFKAYTASYGWSSIRAAANNRVVSAENGGNDPLIANRGDVNDWERFQIVDNPDGSVSLLSRANGKYITADPGNQGKLVASAKGILGWERFWKTSYADGTVSLQAQSNGKYVTADLNNGGVLYASRENVNTWEKFTVAPAP